MLLSKQSTLWTCCNPLKKTYTKGQKYLTNSVHPVNITLIWNVITHHYYAIVTITSPLGSRALHGFLNPAAGISSTTLLVESGTDAEDKACLWVCTPIYPNSAQWHWTQILCRKITSHLTYKAFFFTNLALCKGVLLSFQIKLLPPNCCWKDYQSQKQRVLLQIV